MDFLTYIYWNPLWSAQNSQSSLYVEANPNATSYCNGPDEDGSLCYVGFNGGLSNGRYNGLGGNTCYFSAQSYGSFFTYGYVANAQTSCQVFTVQPGITYTMITFVLWESDDDDAFYLLFNWDQVS